MTTQYQWINVETEGHVATVTLCREQAANSLSQALCLEFVEAMGELQEADVRAVVLTGQGKKAFCAGADLKERKGMAEAEVRVAVHRIRQVVESVAALPMPTIAAVNGVAFGGGTEIALAADLRICAREAQFGLTETGLGIVPGAGGTQRLPRLVGVLRAKELIYTARRISAEEAEHIGLVLEVVESEGLLTRAKELAQKVAANGPIAVRAAKWAIDHGLSEPMARGLQIEEEAYERVLNTEDRLEGLRAFAEKRPPVYRGK
ncbi:MAG: enoyl-CoA hydratase-related protein [Alicyclobacillaceae bacterium]|jgi:enoyl-CoA hydratase/carnithine racemase|uniref:enoyl-CoA hydratase-related protein n=1 Tax=Alicyclobacillus sp. SP_1 TaxID=2942475 RepID=UPI0021588D98|nr:enoyl-CoA hydratase-related protein [Alicyclobacillus sp. SP_1]MCY0886984.1 enoyl-CoA hydratase-related protein [Alicyclobacillaceae bacterium]MCY0897180.1 enoyl-CoA hydratase-related protein [Alicyclobacillaceae bacterium]